MNLSRNEVLSQLRQIDEYEFEHLVADIWGQRGWETTVTTGSSDRGIDVIAQKSSPFKQKQLIQAKRYSVDNKIGSPDIQQYSSLRQQENEVDAVVIVTTSSFTSQAQQTAKDLNVKLIDGNDLIEMISELDSLDSLSEFLQRPAPKTDTQDTTADTKSTDDIRREMKSKLKKSREKDGRFRVTWKDSSGDKHSLISQYDEWNIGGLVFDREKVRGAKIEVRQGLIQTLYQIFRECMRRRMILKHMWKSTLQYTQSLMIKMMLNKN